MIYRISAAGASGLTELYGRSYWLDEAGLHVRTEDGVESVPREGFELVSVEPMTITHRRIEEWPPR